MNKNQSYGSFVDEKGTRAHQSACVLQEQVPSLRSLEHCRHCKMVVPAALSAIYTISLFFFFLTFSFRLLKALEVSVAS